MKIPVLVALAAAVFAQDGRAASDINVEILSKVIGQKQEELRNLAVERVLLAKIADVDSMKQEYQLVQSLVDILLSSQDRTAIEQTITRSLFAYAATTRCIRLDSLRVLVRKSADPADTIPPNASFAEIAARIDQAKLVEELPKVWSLCQQMGPRTWLSKEGKEAKWLIDQIVGAVYYDESAKEARINIVVLLSSIQAHLGGMANHYWEPLFDIGMNYGVDVDHLRGYAFAAEKIGIKLKIRNYRYARAANRGGTIEWPDYTEPKVAFTVVNDFHILAFASGLLYNITSLPNGASPGAPFLGGGLGASLVNGMDVNLYYGMPVTSDKTHWYSGQLVGMGFDIQVGEYLAALKNVVAAK